MGEASSAPREWDAGAYHDVAAPHQQWGAVILDRLPLRGDERVLDLGCGTGRVTAQLLERLGPDGRVVGVDGSARMVAEARRRLGGDPRASFLHQDLLALAVDPPPADAAVSSATFHWIEDHDALFARVRAALRDGGRFVAQCGGRGNIATVVRAVEAVTAREPYASAFAGWPSPWNYAGPEETTERLQRAGFAVERVWLSDSPQRVDDLRGYLRTVSLGSHVAHLPEDLRDGFVDDVATAMAPDPVHDYVRLNIVAIAR